MSNIYAVYGLLLFLTILGFDIYDIRYKRVPNSALVLSLPIFIASPFLLGHTEPFLILVSILLDAVLGAGLGFSILLTAALISKGGAGVGGGDIKLATAMGFAYGPFGVLAILFCASMLCFPFSLILQRKKKTAVHSLPFVPFLAIGSFVLTVIQIIN